MERSISPQSCHGLADCMEDFTRREPTKAVVSAFGVGFVINLLPMGAIVTLLAGIAFSLLRPVLMFLGLVKVCELCGFHPYGPSTPTQL